MPARRRVLSVVAAVRRAEVLPDRRGSADGASDGVAEHLRIHRIHSGTDGGARGERRLEDVRAHGFLATDEVEIARVHVGVAATRSSLHTRTGAP